MWLKIANFFTGIVKTDRLFVYLSLLLLGALVCLYTLTDLDKENLRNRLEIANQSIAFKDSKINLLQLNIQSAMLTIQEQNDKFKALEIDMENLRATKNKVEIKYQKIPVPLLDAECEVKLKYCRGLFKELSDD